MAVSVPTTRNRSKTEMAKLMELARSELQKTIALAERYQEEEIRHAPILKTHIADLIEDVTALEKYKNSFKEREEEMVTLINAAKRIRRDMDREVKNLEIAATNAADRAVAETIRHRKNDSVKTPRIKLPTFDGESSSDYRGFMIAFYSSIGDESDSVKK